jgi:hypothetical protein
VLDERLAGVAVAADHVEDARRQELCGDLGHQQGGLGRGVARLRTTVLPAAIAGRELPDGHHHRVVPRRHLADDPDRLAPDPGRVAGQVLTC